MKQSFDLDEPILEFASRAGNSQFSVRDAVEGILISGGIGSGKTSGSGRTLALKYLNAGLGGCIMTAKPDERQVWTEYCRETGRLDDLIVIEPGSPHHFNFLEYESTSAVNGETSTNNLVEVLKTVIEAGEEKNSGNSNDPFWRESVDQVLHNAIDLCKLAYGTVSISKLFDIIESIPKPGDEDLPQSITFDGKKAFEIAFTRAQENVNIDIENWTATLSADDQIGLNETKYSQETMLEMVPSARVLNFVDQFFYERFIPLSSKTRSIIDFSLSGFLLRLLRDPVYSIFCRHKSTITPDDCLDGKIILINLPVKLYHKAGRDCQILFKYIWQRAIEKRDVNKFPRPVFLWADEAQNFLHQHDAVFQATARSSRICTVYITQNLANLYASMGGDKSEHRVKSFLGTLATKIFHANADIETNKYASELIGDVWVEDTSSSHSISKDVSMSRSKSYKLQRAVRQEEFVKLKTGGPRNGFLAEAYLHKQGDPIANGQNFLKTAFDQNYTPQSMGFQDNE